MTTHRITNDETNPMTECGLVWDESVAAENTLAFFDELPTCRLCVGQIMSDASPTNTITISESSRLHAVMAIGHRLTDELNGYRRSEHIAEFTKRMVTEINRVREYHDLPLYKEAK